jgi:hypothetical protein
MSNVKCYEPYRNIIVIEFLDNIKVYVIYESPDPLDIPLEVLWLLNEYGEKGYMSVVKDQIVLLNRKRIGDDYWTEVLINRYCKEAKEVRE